MPPLPLVAKANPKHIFYKLFGTLIYGKTIVTQQIILEHSGVAMGQKCLPNLWGPEITQFHIHKYYLMLESDYIYHSKKISFCLSV